MKTLWHKIGNTATGRFLRRYWWAYPAFVAVKWSAIAVLGYSVATQSKENAMEAGKNPAEAAHTEALNLKSGDKLPAFTLAAWSPGRDDPLECSSDSLVGKGPVAIYFYPMDDTPG
jgi:hypothetical protein